MEEAIESKGEEIIRTLTSQRMISLQRAQLAVRAL